MKRMGRELDWVESPGAPEPAPGESADVFGSLFERSADAIWLHEVSARGTATLVDCNQAAVKLIGAQNKEELLGTGPEHLSPELQPDGTPSAEQAARISAIVRREKTHRFEWALRRLDGQVIPIEVAVTEVMMGGRHINVAITRDISERKQAERDLLEMNQSLERRVSERTAALSTSEARLRILVEHAPEAIVVFDGDSGRFLFGNEHACRLYGVAMERLAELTPADVSPEMQPCGGRSTELAREKMDEALAGGRPVFEWIHRQPSGCLIPTEVRLLRLPAEGQNLIRASIIDNTERKRAERALRESEAKFRALFEGSSHGVVLMDEDKLLEVNPAAVQILGRQSPSEMLGKHPSEFSPPLQANGVSSAVMAGRYIEECMVKGSVRLEWLCSSPEGREIPLEVLLTRIEWSGKKMIQAFITDITERKKAERALQEANRELHREIEQRKRAEESLQNRVRMSTLNAAVAVALNSDQELRTMLQQCAELLVQHLDAAFARIWILNETTQTLELEASAGCYTHLDGAHSRVKVGQFKIGQIAQEKRPLLTNAVQNDPKVSDHAWAVREGMVSFAGYPLLIEDCLLGVLALFARRPLAEDLLETLCSIADSVALGIERKQAETALAESEARFSAAFRASPVLVTIARFDDGKYVLANPAFLNWTGYSQDEVLGHNSHELGLWANPADRELLWADLRRERSIHERECLVRNRYGKVSIMLVSVDTIEINRLPHLLIVAMDISERKQAETELHRTLAREMELSQLKSNFVSMVSHEFRTPLGIIQSSAELLRDFHDRMERAEREEQFESISRNARRMGGMMEEILVLSRLDAGKLNFQPAALDLKSFCGRVVEEVHSATNRRCPIDLAFRRIPLQAEADERLLGHILTNLLSNAVKYSEPGANVKFEVARAGEELVCVISDEGIGISEEDQQQLFHAFHRGSNVGSRPGTGLGLLLVKRCADLHGGKVQLQSGIGKGTTVTVKLTVFRREL